MSTYQGICIIALTCIITIAIERVIKGYWRASRSKNKYKHQPLKSPESYIRLVVLQPGVETDPISVTVSHVFLHAAPSYEALSYAWGDPSIRVPIRVEELEFQVTINLESALRHLRKRSEPRTIWIDAICINQFDLHERNQQVAKMKDIYAKAAHVLVWLGAEAKESNIAMDAIGSENGFAATWLAQSDSNERHKMFKAVDELLQRSWWSRVWVVQEVLSRDNVLVSCGFRSVPWKDIQLLFTGLEVINHWNARDGEEPLPLHFFEMAARLQYICHAVHFTNVLTHLHRLRLFEASDPRDKVWVPFGILSQNWMTKPDYSLSLISTYGIVVSQYLRAYDNLDILEHCHGQGSLGYAAHYVPSWIPDWRVKSVRLSFAETSQKWGKKFAASQGRKPAYKILDGIGLHIDGFVLDKIQFVENFPAIKEYLYPTKDVLELREKTGYYYRNGEEEVDYVLYDIKRAGMPTYLLPSLGSFKTGPKLQDWPEMHQKLFAENVVRGAETVVTGRKLMISQEKYLGLVPDDAKTGDLICILAGGNTPFVLRSFWNRYRIVGSCYVYGVMYGEAMDMLNTGKATAKSFMLF